MKLKTHLKIMWLTPRYMYFMYLTSYFNVLIYNNAVLAITAMTFFFFLPYEMKAICPVPKQSYLKKTSQVKTKTSCIDRVVN